MKVTIEGWYAVGTWKWDIENQDTCVICQSSFQSPCSRCKVPGDDCVPIQGQCTHHFHLHCILKWTEEGGNQECPLCRNKWAVKN